MSKKILGRKVITVSSDTFECICGLLNHTMKLTHFKDDKTLYIEQLYSYDYPWYTRIWLALRYIFQTRHIYLTETELYGNDLKKFIKFIDSIKKEKKNGK